MRKTVVVRNGPDIELQAIVLDRGGELQGVVTDQTGQPLPEAYVWVVDPLDDENRDRMAWPDVEEDHTFSAHLSRGAIASASRFRTHEAP